MATVFIILHLLSISCLSLPPEGGGFTDPLSGTLKIGIGPSSSHTMGPMVAARMFLHLIRQYCLTHDVLRIISISCTLKGSLSATGKGHATDRAIALGLNDYSPKDAADQDLDTLVNNIWDKISIKINGTHSANFSAKEDIIFDMGKPLPEHPNGLIFELFDDKKHVLVSETYFSIGGGFINTSTEIKQLVAPLKMKSVD